MQDFSKLQLKYSLISFTVILDVILDPSVRHNISFIVSTIPPLDCAPVLKKIADYLDTATCKL